MKPLDAPAATLAQAEAATRPRRSAWPWRVLRVCQGSIALVAAATAGAWWLGVDGLPIWTAICLPLFVGHLCAWLSWRWRPSAFALGRGVTPATLFMGLALGFATVLLLMFSERTLNTALWDLSYGTPWEGLVAGFAWGTVLLLLPAVALVAWLAWRALCFALLEGRLSARVPHSLVWSVLAMGHVCTLLLAGAIISAPSTSLARQLSIFLGDYAAPMWLVYGGYALLLVALGVLTGPAPARLPPLVVVTARTFDRRRWFGAHELHRLATTWGEGRGPVVLVRPATRAPQRAGLHARWAAFNGRLDELFVSDEHSARRWCAAWLGEHASRAPGLFVRECFVREASALAPLIATLTAQHSRALFMLVLGSQPDATWIEELQHALPKRQAFTLDEPEAPPVARLSSLAGRLSAPWRLSRAIEQQMRAPPSTARIAVLGRPRSDALADRLVMALDQRKDAHGRIIDALRPARDDMGTYETVLLLVDVAWLAGEREARNEAAALSGLAASARRLAVVTDLEVSEAQLAQALSTCAAQRQVTWYGTLPATAASFATWQQAAQRIALDTPQQLLAPRLPGCVRAHVALEVDERLHMRLSYALQAALGGERVLSGARADQDADLLVVVLTPAAVEAIERSDSAEVRAFGGTLLRAGKLLPVLLDDAHMPRSGLDPSLLHRLTARAALPLRGDVDARGLQRLIAVVRELLNVAPRPELLEAASILIFGQPSEASPDAMRKLEGALLERHPNAQVHYNDGPAPPPPDLVVVLVDVNAAHWLRSAQRDGLGMALQGDAPVLCVLLDNAVLPANLPASLAALANAPAVRSALTDRGFDALGEVQRAAHGLLVDGLALRGAPFFGSNIVS